MGQRWDAYGQVVWRCSRREKLSLRGATELKRGAEALVCYSKTNQQTNKVASHFSILPLLQPREIRTVVFESVECCVASG